MLDPICVRCGDDLPCEGHDLCLDCLEATDPDPNEDPMTTTHLAVHYEGTEPELVQALAAGGALVDLLPGDAEWWIAEDDRSDRSDCASAVFVPMGRQADAIAVLRAAGILH